MTSKYAIQRKTDGLFWMGGEGSLLARFHPDRWTADPLCARSFEFMADAIMTAFTECAEPCQNWTAVPIAALVEA